MTHVRRASRALIVSVLLSLLGMQGGPWIANVHAASPQLLFKSSLAYQIGTGTTPWAVVATDFNGDGRSDVATANQDGNSVAVLLNNGDGTLSTPPAIYSVGSRPVALVSGDFNGDGKPDLAVASSGSSTVSILLNRGDGTFYQPNPPIPVAANPVALAVGDFNLDGKLDLAVTSQYDSSITLLKGQGDGTFHSSSLALGAMQSASAIAVGDFNGDGIPDLMVGGSYPGISEVFLGHGDGTFSVPLSFSANEQITGIAVGDFNGDGKLDFAMTDQSNCCASTSAVSIYLGKGDGTFRAGAQYHTYSPPYSLAIADLNGDGKLDLVAGLNGGVGVAVLIGNGDGTFSGPDAYASTGSIYGVAIADLNGDGKLDVAATDASSMVAVLPGNGDGSFGTGPTPIPLTTGSQGTDAMAAGDFNGDGLSDFAVADREAKTVHVLLSRGDGTFFEPAPAYSVGVDAYKIVATDLNADGKTDLVLTGLSSGTVVVLLGNGDGTFRPGGTYPAGLSAISLAVGDFNGDGKPDIAVANSYPREVSILLGKGDGSFAAPSTIPFPDTPDGFKSGLQDIIAGDWNGDGKTDLAVADYYGIAVFVLNGLGNGTFSAPVRYAIRGQPLTLAPGDFRGTGKQDILATSSLLVNNGDGTFHVTKVDTGTLYPPTGEVVGDFNGDGKADVAFVLADDVMVALGNGDGTFTPSPIAYASGHDGSGMALGDFRGDGKPGVAVVHLEGSVTVLQSLAGTFLPGQGGRAAQTITFGSPGTHAYGDTPFTVSAIASSGLPLAYTASPSAICTNTGSLITIVGVGTCKVTASQAGNASFQTASAEQDYTIDRGVLAVTASNGHMIYGGSAPTITPSYSGFVNGEGASILSTLPSCTAVVSGAPASATTPAGMYPGATGCSGGAASNYTLQYSTGTLRVEKATPVLTWANPADIGYGMKLNGTQMNATASVPGTFVYAPSAGTLLSVGANQPLSVTFTPIDAADYTPATATVHLNVSKAIPTTAWSNPADITYGTPLSATQLNAQPSFNGTSVDGTFTYTPAAGTVLNAGNGQTLSVSFTPTDTTNFTPSTGAVQINVLKATPSITWSSPADTAYGTVLDGTQLDATSGIPGTFAYTPAAGTVLNAGAGQTLSVTFTPDTAGDYNSASKSVTINVVQASPKITWANPVDITYGTVLSTTQLNATANVAGAFTYTPDTGTVLGAGSGQTLKSTFTPTDSVDYTGASKSVIINVTQVAPTISWANPADIVYGTKLDATQLNATANIDGTFTYTPAAGMLLSAGNSQALSASFTPTDSVNYTTTSAAVQLNVLRATPKLTWSSPADITYGATLGDTQLNATASVPGSFVYTPASGTVLKAGNAQPLLVAFTPTDTGNYTDALASSSINVLKATATIAWSNPADITYGTALNSTQLNAQSSFNGNPVDGTFTYTPVAGTVLNAGNGQTLSVTFVPSDTTNFSPSTAGVQINVLKATPSITWANPANITYGTALDSTQLNASSSVPGSFAYTPVAGTVLSAGPGQTLKTSFTPTDTGNYTTASTSVSINVLQATPVITWATPADIVYGTKLDATQLDATASAPGTFVYAPTAGTVLNAGDGQTLSTTFTPTDSGNYTPATATVQLKVLKATPQITWTHPADITYGQKLGDAQLNATASVPGNFTYTPGAGTVLGAGAGQALNAVFTPNDAANYNNASSGVSITVVKATPSITWPTPADITYGTKLGDAQLDATANVPGTFVYSPASGAGLAAGPGQALTTAFTPTDSTNYTSATASVAINVLKATPHITWSNPADITYGTALDNTQLDATADVPGSFAYTPASGTVLKVGNTQPLSVSFTPSDTGNYTTSSASSSINVLKATPAIAWSNPKDITYGTPLSATQLNAQPSFNSSSVDGTYTYTPPVGTVLGAGTHQTLSVSFVPSDTTSFNVSTANIQITVLKATPSITWATLADITYGAALGSTQLNAQSSFNGNPLAGTFVYTPAAGSLLNAGSGQALSVNFAPSDSANFNTTSATVQINVLKATPQITWANPADITYGTALGAAQLNATANVPGSFAYTPAASTVLHAGSGQTLSAAFTPTDSGNYTGVSKSVSINIQKANQTITFGTFSGVTYGHAPVTLTATATSGLPVSYSAPVTDPCTVTGASLTITGIGTCHVTAAQSGGSNYDAASSAEQDLSITKALTSLTTSATPQMLAYEQPAALSATLTANGSGLSGKTVTLSLGSQRCQGTTTATGSVTCTLPALTSGLGPQPISVHFLGDTDSLPSTGSGSAIVFFFLKQGAFTLGDKSLGPGQVTWFSGDWAASNTLSGGPAPASFLGFAASLDREPPHCGGSFTNQPGHDGSKDPRTSARDESGFLLSYMGIIVSSHITKSGSAITGNISQIVVVKTDLGHLGKGTVVGTFCHS